MPATTMDRFAEAQEKICQRRVEASVHYPAFWDQIIAEWNTQDPQDRVWLTYSANYIFRTSNVRWAIDPLTLKWRLKTAPAVNITGSLDKLSFVLLTHAHKDHLDLDLLSALKHLPIRWVVPDFILPDVLVQTGLPLENIIVPAPLSPIDLHGLRILPFNGLHWETTEKGTLRGLPAMGYLVESHGRRWLFPGDVRTYDPARLPVCPGTDLVFAHLWLGRGAALEERPPLLETFCRFYSETGARRVILTHLHELGRDADDYWDEKHVQLVRGEFQEMSVKLPISPLIMSQSLPL